MKIHIANRNARGITIIECLIYLAVFAIIMTTAYMAMYACWNNSAELNRNSDDIIRAVRAGEQWRADIRNATASPIAEAFNGGQLVRIPQKSAMIFYRFDGHACWRQAAAGGESVKLIDKVHVSEMKADPRKNASAWMWELSLETSRKPVFMQPLFSFAAALPPQTK
jgi:hypothetical protein